MFAIFRRALGAVMFISFASTAFAVDFGRTQGAFNVVPRTTYCAM